MQSYNFSEIEKKWQDIWDETKVFAAEDFSDKEKFYCLIEFPYPSANGLHVGHPRSYTALDLVARKRRLEGYNVLYPMGWDAFGLPTENFAIKNKIHPAIVTKNNIANFKRQLKSLGYSFDWDREINTTDPEYYKWTQWIFIQLFKKGLAYKSKMKVNWCPEDKTVLANEEVIDGACERCGAQVIHKDKEQWMLKITAYADRLVDDLDDLDFIERVKTQQKNWIGRSHGAQIKFNTNIDEFIEVYTTRPDTIFGATYLVLSPEHELLKLNEDKIKNLDEVKAYQEFAASKSDFERTEMNKEKTGVKIEGISAINPANNKEVPIFISDYVLSTYGTGAIMAVPAHDTRDYEFAKKFDLDIVEVVSGGDISESAYTDTDSGILVNSDFLNGKDVKDAIEFMFEWLESEHIGERKTNFKLRDWVFSRQRYWGEPIPIVDCENCGLVALPESELPLTLPEVEVYEPTDTGESPLANITDWVETTCPDCGGKAKRETDTMPQWAGSSWYYLRYVDPHNNEALASKDKIDYWMPIDWYNGGMEHTTLHLLYSRFWYKFLFDLGVVDTSEPYMKRTSHGMILGENGEKMSKSRGNVVNPDEIIENYGADTLRVYEVFIGDFEKAAPWNTNGIKGCLRFLERVWSLQEILVDGEEYRTDTETLMHQSIKKVGEDIEKLKGNTAVAQLMTLINKFFDLGQVNKAELATFLILLNPFAPHIAEEIWENVGFSGRITDQTWPEFEESKTIENEIEIAVQVNGKVRDKLVIARDLDKDEVMARAKELEGVQSYLEGKTIVKEIYVPQRLVNIVVK
ncbi:leucine--tRNA ligase [Fastidiosipila sanguinis]|uniref:Leucine--tRNA ligase n=1 Tax=Fastidiosipila sanguinis TaxID=236753 RepID=A0A2S0KNN7_9FIRM|nr:leucine--tRNA ligase [Fastidiosipila sanguinis]AVM42651.1 leucine--tRNA ligase [Fastidiosipila sanguinis]